MEIEFRLATKNDADFLTWGVPEALHTSLTPEQTEAFSALLLREDVLYSWKNAIIAQDTVTKQPLGMVIGYDGGRYRDMRAATFPTMQKIFKSDYSAMDDESVEGEFYIDSLAVRPEARCMGLGKRLLLEAMEHSRRLGLKKAVLAVDPENVNAQRLYKSLGFVPGGELFIFGQTFWRWVKEF